MKTLFRRGFIIKPIKRAYVLLKNDARNFQNNTPFEIPAYFYVTVTVNFERFQYFNFGTNSLKNKLFFQKA